MPLPKIATPTYELVIPSTKKKIKYRPFLVKEEKVLIIAMESEDSSTIASAVKDVISGCILTRGVKVEELSTFDIEYLFLNIRGKSVGEDVEVMITCPDDGETKVPAVKVPAAPTVPVRPAPRPRKPAPAPAVKIENATRPTPAKIVPVLPPLPAITGVKIKSLLPSGN